MRNAIRPGLIQDLERRDRDRRRRHLWSVVYGSFNPRRRTLPRRLDESRFHSLDWYSSHLLAIAVGILLLSAADAFMTVILLLSGAYEVNPLMAELVYRSVALFTAFKMGMTGSSVLLMVFLSRYRFMRFLRVELVLYAVLIGYMTLIAYEMQLLMGSPDLALL